MKAKKKKLSVLNMCDFCVYEIKTCKSHHVFSNQLENGENLSKKNAVIACDKYESPMRTIETQHY